MNDITPEAFLARYDLLRSDPQHYVEMMTDLIRQDVSDASNYFSRHHGWVRLNRPDLALEDLNQAIKLNGHPVEYFARGEVLMNLGRYREALEDFDKGESVDEPGHWRDMWGPLYQADCHARLGDEQAALAACAKLNDDHWAPGLSGTPAGNKAEVIAEIRRRAARGRATTLPGKLEPSS